MSFPQKWTLDQQNRCSYNPRRTSFSTVDWEDVRMDRKQAKVLIDGLTYEQKLELRELLLALRQSRLLEQSLEESDQTTN